MAYFVYGTLTNPQTASTVLDTFDFQGEATLQGLHRVDGEYPTLAPGGTVTGRLLETDETEALDRYEGIEHGLYIRVALPRTDGTEVETYVGHPGRLGVEDEWPGEGPFAERLHQYLERNDVVVER